MNIRKTAFVATALLASSLANAQWSANIGFASDYYFRGIFQSQSSASGGIDYNHENGFYAGVWAADVEDEYQLGGGGMEVDGYLGYTGTVGDFSYGIGFTGYYYTQDFDDTYQEINLSGGYGIATIDVAVGEYDNFDGPTQDYTYYSLTVAKAGFYGKYAGFSQDADGEYFEVGYGATVADIDLGVYIVFNDEDLSGTGDDDDSLVFTIGKSFDLQ